MGATGGLLGFAMGVSLLASTGACADRETVSSDPNQAKVTTTLSRDLDILLIIDKSGSLVEEQAALAQSFGLLAAQLSEADIGSLHFAVISSDVGAGSFGIFGCEGDGDNGQFRTEPTSACTPFGPEHFLIDDDLRCVGASCSRNYDGTLAESLSCVASLGVDGCGFEQPLESMRRALDGTNEFNDGFLRDDAMLAVLFMTDEDDCSVFDPGMFDTAQTRLTDPLGPVASYRCFDFGVVCDPDNPREPGEKQNCRPRPNSPYMTDVSDFSDFLIELKGGDATQVLIAGIAGPPTPVKVQTREDDPNTLELVHSCVNPLDDMDGADPAVRLAAFASTFGANGSFFPVCDFTQSGGAGFQGFADSIAQRVGDNLDVGCLPETLVTSDQPGEVAISCVVNAITSSGVERIPECGGDDDTGCFLLEVNPQCAGGEDGRSLRVRRESTATGERITADCDTEVINVRESYYECSSTTGGHSGWLATALALIALAVVPRRRRRRRTHG